jgi:putative ABC transport system substrate-binding protein
VITARFLVGAVVALISVAAPCTAQAQQARLYRIGVVLHGGTYADAVVGLRSGLKNVGLEEGRHYVFHLRETRGELKAVAALARGLESEKVDLIYSLATSVTLEAKAATKSVPIVFYAGTDPVAARLVESFAKPGGRLTGIHGRSPDLTGKRLQLLKEMLPKLNRVVTFYNPDIAAARESIKIGRHAARNLKVELVEHPVRSVEELRAALRSLRPGQADAFFYVADAMMTSQAPLIIDAGMSIGLPAMFADRSSAVRGGLASYGVSYHAIGVLSARYVQRILHGAPPADLPVEQVDTPHLTINLKTASALGVAIPTSVLTRADEVIQ